LAQLVCDEVVGAVLQSVDLGDVCGFGFGEVFYMAWVSDWLISALIVDVMEGGSGATEGRERRTGEREEKGEGVTA
jgi:hypothetical protein